MCIYCGLREPLCGPLLTFFCSCLGLSRQFGYLDRYQSHDQCQRRDHILTHHVRFHLMHRQKIEKGGAVI